MSVLCRRECTERVDDGERGRAREPAGRQVPREPAASKEGKTHRVRQRFGPT
jgi:hypothetical protein